MKNQKGFTLLEVIIAVVILTSIVVLTARMVQKGVEYKQKIQGNIDRFSSSREVLALMSRDIATAFNYRDINVELFNAAQKERQRKSQQGKGGGGGGSGEDDGQGGSGGTGGTGGGGTDDETDPDAFKLKEVVTYTRFVGENEKMDFTSLNNFRSSRDLKQSNQIEIGYFLKNCRSRKDRTQSTQCLWRRTSPYLDKEIKEGGTQQPILENVKSLKFRYLTTGDTEDVWKENWSSIEAQSTTEGTFPIAVEITLVTEQKNSKKDKELALTVVAPLQFPNNPTQKNEDPTNAQTTQ